MQTSLWKRTGALLCALAVALTLHISTLAQESGFLEGADEWAEISLFSEEEQSYQPSRPHQVIRVLLDGEELSGDVPAFLMEGRTLLPLRLVSEAIGASVEWESEKRQTVVTRGETQLIFTLGSPVALVNGAEEPLPDEVSPCLASAMGGERTMVPLRFFAERLGFQVEWEEATRTVYLTTAPLPEEKITVVLDAGHGGDASGAIYEGVMEKDLTLPITLRVAELLEGKGYHVVLTRADDSYVTLGGRSDIANQAQGDIFVSIHANASNIDRNFQGTFTYYFPGSKSGKELARTVQRAVTEAAGSVDRGILSENFAVLRGTNMPAVLVETGFMTCHQELMRLCDPEYREKLAQGIAQGVEDYLAGQE